MGVSKQIIEVFFHLWSLSSGLVAFYFTLEVHYLPLTSFNVVHANHDCLSFFDFIDLALNDF